jgi:hypothetical protein
MEEARLAAEKKAQTDKKGKEIKRPFNLSDGD